MTVDASGSANGAAAGGGRNNGTAPQCVVPRPAATTTTTTTTTFRRAGMPSPKEFFTMAALCLASAFAFFCCPIFMERPQQDRYEGAATTLPPTDQHWGVGQAASQQK
ncbi:uncharacterized protein LOC123512694 isoform X2 [Portunus trituberculatus]|uniref:uncharacterized protein LOC123512694 isoform X2 n=1 Tax=Portunus trituberculatus TaxID=210409 RepID=UPI001E1D0670|nr:uncharacterized protein LOC123512694 isoform X2 [Portunus trituberculatus]